MNTSFNRVCYHAMLTLEKTLKQGGFACVLFFVLACPATASSQVSQTDLVQQIMSAPNNDPSTIVGAFSLLTNPFAAVESDADRTELFQRVGKAYLALGDGHRALEMFFEAQSYASKQNNRFLAFLYADLGLAYVRIENWQAALDSFNKGLEISNDARDFDAQVASLINITRFKIDLIPDESVLRHLRALEGLLNENATGSDAAFLYVSLGKLYRDAIQTGVISQSYRAAAYQAYRNGEQKASSSNNEKLLEFSAGYIGELYEDEEKYDSALRFTRTALFKAQASENALDAYRWEWQLARIYLGLKDVDAAVASYRQALSSVSLATSLTSQSVVDFRKEINPLFYEFADLLLEQSDLKNDELKTELLNEVVRVLESVKLAEVQDYFNGNCVLLPEQAIDLAEIDTSSAVIYPILLKDRVEVIARFPTGPKRFVVNVSKTTVKNRVNDYRTLLEGKDLKTQSSSSPVDYLEIAQDLYSWIVRPLEKDLIDEKISTIVFVPDSALRTIPLSALHDGREFLVQNYAIATTPGITLTEPQAFEKNNVSMLASGLSKAVQNFSKLPAVEKELQQLPENFEAKIFLNEDYVLESVEREMAEGDYQIVHFATHGVFDRDHTKSFLLTYDGKLTMDRLEQAIGYRRFQSNPLELLVLSACQTALGDDKAALGLAGVAVKAGARSAVATLWSVNDEATSQLISDFYHNLEAPGVSKAEALMLAQQKMVSSEKHKHPMYWAPFLLIGNWL